jgi:ABC-type Na+ efflux pump permease subunit
MDRHNYQQKRMPFSSRNIKLNISSDDDKQDYHPLNILSWFMVYAIASLLAVGLFIFSVIAVSGYQNNSSIFQPMVMLVFIPLLQILTLYVFVILRHRQGDQ